jgi:hypothetical protein
MNVFTPIGHDPDRRHNPASWAFACWYAYALLDVPVSGEWPDPQPAAVPRTTRNRKTPAELLDGKEGNQFVQRGTAIEKAFGNAVLKHAPKAPASATYQPSRDTIPDTAGGDENACADWEFRWSSLNGGHVFDVTAINTRSVGRTAGYSIPIETLHSRDRTAGPHKALSAAAREKHKIYTNLYNRSEFSAYATDLVGTPSSCSREALTDLCINAYKETELHKDVLYPHRMVNAILKEVAIAAAKATAIAIFRDPREPPTSKDDKTSHSTPALAMPSPQATRAAHTSTR